MGAPEEKTSSYELFHADARVFALASAGAAVCLAGGIAGGFIGKIGAENSAKNCMAMRQGADFEKERPTLSRESVHSPIVDLDKLIDQCKSRFDIPVTQACALQAIAGVMDDGKKIRIDGEVLTCPVQSTEQCLQN